MPSSQNLSRVHIENYLVCKRRYFLRYLSNIPWPESPYDPPVEEAFARGREFHLLAERHFKGLPVDPATIESSDVRLWWQAFHGFAKQLPDGQQMAELSLTVPFEIRRLFGRFDLLILDKNEDGRPAAHIYDWKTSRPLSDALLRQAWQSRLYMALLVEGQSGLPQAPEPALRPEDVTFTYWFASEPDRPRTLTYDSAQHDRSLAELRDIIEGLEREADKAAWPKTDDWAACRLCTYQVYCGRQEAGQEQPAEIEIDDVEEQDDFETLEQDF